MHQRPFQLDKEQQRLAQRLTHLACRIDANQSVEQGLYIWGPVGRGKSMLMNHFFSQLQTPQKKRVHFHHFMAQIHRSLQSYSGQADPLQSIAADWAAEYRVLCLDEFMVEDIGDAMLLGTLWRHLFDLEMILITTSNTPPEKLYYNGLQRQRFLPTIDLLMKHCEVLHLDGGKDYRLTQNKTMPHYLLNGSKAQLRELTEQRFGQTEPVHQVQVMNRTINCLWQNENIIAFNFMELCSGPRSQRDYMELASRFRAIAVHQVPEFSYIPDKELVHGVEESYQREQQQLYVSKLDNEARRFIALVDECYDRNCLLLVSAQVPPEQLYQARQLAVPFQRCNSRLYEMQRW
ncbi:cell division protein ZapE [Aliidiomarina minuta]|uniref:Cell division protein ZapE n=1 Tax=Aliidiomarina minuta TaxID=880057 RepID=A0A432W128_9GAMM|nr:cell division protein ZapE [Aliidiomarina minuta]RUO22930.1 cell division protein ZapE [Aliidiomarina minuta]